MIQTNWLSVLDKYCPSWDFSSFSVVINFLYFSNIPFDFFIEFLAVYCCLSSGTLFQFPELIHYHWRKVLFQIVLSPKLQMYLEKHFANCTTEVQSPDESRSTPVKVQQFFVLAGAGWTARESFTIGGHQHQWGPEFRQSVTWHSNYHQNPNPFWQDQEFPKCLPSNYCPDPMLLNFCFCMGTWQGRRFL